MAANAQSTYSNAKYEIGEVDGPGYWDTEFYSELTELEYILGDAKNTVVTHQSGVHDGAFSAWNNKCAATVEEIIHEFNTEAKEHLEETGEKAVHTGYVDEGGHGTVIAYANLEDTEIEAEHPWQFVDTTRATVAPVTEDPPSTGNYNAFVDGYSSDKLLGDYSTVETGIKATESGTLYRNEKRIASWSLENFVMNGEGNHADMDEELLGITTAISDTILEDIFNDHVPSGGSVDPIIDMVEKAIDLRQDTRKRIHVYGESLEDYEMAVVEDDELYRRSMDPEETVGTEEVENYLANLPS